MEKIRINFVLVTFSYHTQDLLLHNFFPDLEERPGEPEGADQVVVRERRGHRGPEVGRREPLEAGRKAFRDHQEAQVQGEVTGEGADLDKVRT